MKESPGRIEFMSLLLAQAGKVVLPVPREVSAALGQRGRVDLKGTVNGRVLRAPAMPDGKGGHTIQLGEAFTAGERVKVVLERIEQEAPVETPLDLAKALSHNVAAKAAWEKFPPAQRRLWVEFLASTNKPDVRARRISEALGRIALGKTP